jgi:hypothetical protein
VAQFTTWRVPYRPDRLVLILPHLSLIFTMNITLPSEDQMRSCMSMSFVGYWLLTSLNLLMVSDRRLSIAKLRKE